MAGDVATTGTAAADVAQIRPGAAETPHVTGQGREVAREADGDRAEPGRAQPVTTARQGLPRPQRRPQAPSGGAAPGRAGSPGSTG